MITLKGQPPKLVDKTTRLAIITLVDGFERLATKVGWRRLLKLVGRMTRLAVITLVDSFERLTTKVLVDSVEWPTTKDGH